MSWNVYEFANYEVPPHPPRWFQSSSDDHSLWDLTPFSRGANLINKGLATNLDNGSANCLLVGTHTYFCINCAICSLITLIRRAINRDSGFRLWFPLHICTEAELSPISLLGFFGLNTDGVSSNFLSSGAPHVGQDFLPFSGREEQPAEDLSLRFIRKVVCFALAKTTQNRSQNHILLTWP